MRILLSAILLTVALRGGEASGKKPAWIDPATHLMWATADSGSGVSFTQAAIFCRASSLAGYHDWRLPSIDELQTLFGGPADEGGHHVLGPVKLTGWIWSSSPGRESGERWGLDFGDGGRASLVMGDSGLNRALCVHQSKGDKETP